MTVKKITCLLVVFLCWTSWDSNAIAATGASLHQTVEMALNYSPRLQALAHERDAYQFDLKQAKGRYLPVVDVLLGYGLEQHSDDATRQVNADPSDQDWDPRSEGSVKLSQLLYDGGESSSQVDVQQSKLEASHYYFYAEAQMVALEAIMAHCDVYKLRQQVVLARNNLSFHLDIYKSLSERAEAGSGSIAEVTQAQVRMARAQSNLFSNKSALARSEATYRRLVGHAPEGLAYAAVPGRMPANVESAQLASKHGNPSLRALDADIRAAQGDVQTAKSNYLPRLFFEVNSDYADQVEGDKYWQNTNSAMLQMRWNLFNGGQDSAAENAALARKKQSQSFREAEYDQIIEATVSAWADLTAAKALVKTYREGVDYAQKTLQAYMAQYDVSQRSLLDVLDAGNEYFQAAAQLIVQAGNETVAGYRTLSLSGELRVPEGTAETEEQEFIQNLLLETMALGQSQEELTVAASTSESSKDR